MKMDSNKTWKGGTWLNGTWLNGTWEFGTWLNGTWVGGVWENGTWETGWIFDPEKKGNFEKNWKWIGSYVLSPINPRDYFDPNYRLKRNLNSLGDWLFMNNNIDSDLLWKDGIWEDGTWKDGTWYSGTWKNGTWKNGNWKNGIWEGGYWTMGTWENGTWKAGVWERGLWENGTWNIGWIKDPERKGNFEKDWIWISNHVKSLINPKDYFDPNYKLKKNLNSLEDLD